MKLNKMTKEDLELLSYTKIAEMYLKENKITMTTAELFKKVCELLELSENEYQDKIADFFESLTTCKEFILLNDGKWDLRVNHKIKIEINEIYDDKDDEIDNETNDDDEEIESEEDEEEEFDNESDDDFEDEDEDLSDLTIVDEDELE